MASTTVTTRLSASTRTASATPSSALSATAQTWLYLRSTIAYAYLQFTLPRDLAGSTVVSAKIEIRGEAAWAGSRSVTAQRITPTGGATSIAFSKVTWNNAPPLTAGSSPRVGGLKGTSTLWYEIDVTDDLALVAAGAPYHGHRISTSDATLRRFAGQASNVYPRLVLTYATTTPAPTAVQPNGTVAVAKPRFSWAAPRDVTLVQAQADEVDGDFSTPTWTSAELASTLGFVDTDAAGWAGLADGASAELQFRQSGVTGWSPWSAPVTVTRDDYATLTSVQPVAGSDTNDPTPPHAWTFAGQKKFQLTVLRGATTVYDSGQVAGSDQDWTPVLSTLNVPNGTVMTSRLRTWDAVTDRVPSPGDRGYAETSWNWTINPSSATDPVTWFGAAVEADRPVVSLQWARTDGEPDAWIVERDGVLAYRLEAGEPTALSLTTWRYEDWTCPPNRDVVYCIRAVVAGKMSAASQRIVVHHRLTGVVIAEPVSGAWINVAGDAADGLNKTESVAIYKGPYAQGAVKRVLAMGGIEGTVAGQLSETSDRPIEEQLEAAALIRGHATRKCRLVYGFVNVPVLVSAVSPMLAGDAIVGRRMTHRVSLEVDQVGEFDTPPAGLDD